MSKIGLVIGREYSSRVKKKSFIVLTILIPLLFGLAALAAIWLGVKDQKHLKVLISDPLDVCQSKIFVAPGENPPATFYFTAEDLNGVNYDREDLKTYDIIIGISPTVFTNKKIKLHYREEPNLNAQKYISKKLDLRLEEYFAIQEGISLETYRKIKQAYSIEMEDITTMNLSDEEKEMAANKTARQAVGFGFSIFIFLFLIIYASQVMRGVLEEKTSRVVEIVVSSVRPFDLMMGKIAAVGLVGITQFFIWILMVFLILLGIQYFALPEIDPAAFQAMGPVPQGMDGTAVGTDNEVALLIFEQINWPIMLTLFVLYFIGGYLLYGSLFAIVGAASDSETDTQQLIIPVMIPLMFVYFVSFSIIGNAEGQAAVWGSQIPFSSPIIMLQRVAAGTVEPIEVIISLIVLTATFILTTYLAAKVYRVGILMYGKKASWKEIYKWLKH